jgi:creatinine amidohydrolase
VLRLLSELNRVESAQLAPEALLLLPIGATEQHGPHLPSGTDAILVELVALAAAQRLPDSMPVVMAPTLSIGSSAHHVPFGATLSLTTQTYLHVLMDLGRSAAASGFRQLFFLNGHGGNHELAQVAARDLALELPINVGVGSWWAMAYDQLRAVGTGSIENVPGHAGAFETAMILACRPDLVREPPSRPARTANAPAFRGGTRAERHGSWQRIDGHTDSPADATAELGNRCFEVAVSTVAAELSAFVNG